MAYFQWADDMAIDHGPIDQDHMVLVELVNQLHTATSQGLGCEVVGKVLEDLIRYTAEHLSKEEQLMQRAGFPHLEKHKLGHTKFIDDLRALQAKYEGGSITVAAQLSTVLRDWLSLHIRRSDKALMVFLNGRTKG
jgi:hemerythrin